MEKWELSQQEKTWFKLLHYICWYRGTFEQSYPIISKWTICHILVAPQTSEKKHLNPIPGRGGINYLDPQKLKKWHFSKFKIFEKWHFSASNPLETINIDMWNHFLGLEITLPPSDPQKNLLFWKFLNFSIFPGIFKK